MLLNTDRTIDDPGLNQDSTFDKKGAEDFDDTDDFHKHDDTSKDNSGNSKKNERRSDTDGKSDGSSNT